MPSPALRSRPVRILVATLAGAVAALAVPYGNLWLKCLQPTSEACVWAKAYLVPSLGLTAFTLGIPVFVVALILLRRFAAEPPR